MNTAQIQEETPVLIVGGSLVGLSASLFLSWQGIPSLLVERHMGISPHPRAFNFNSRTMETFHMIGVDESIRRRAPIHFQNSRILRAETLAGREITWLTQDTTGNDFSCVPGCIIGQDQLEPVLRACAEERGGDLRFNTELLSYEQDESGVTAHIQDRASGTERTVHARYLIAADGSRGTIRKGLGIQTHGPGSLGHRISILFSADMQSALRGRRVAVCFVQNAAVPPGTSLIFAKNGEGYALFSPYHPEKGEKEEDFAGERGIELVRGAIGIPDQPIEILNVSSWEVAAWVAGRFQQQNVFLSGDSVHVVPPAGAFGANMGIADAWNLAWKLALVLKGAASSKLLSTYSEERQPVVRFTAEQTLLMMKGGSGVVPEGAVPSTPLAPYNSVAFGYRYHSSALPQEPEDQGWYEDPTHPTGTPGAHAAHVTLENGGKQSSTLDLFGKHFVLLTGAEGEGWHEPASRVAARLGLTLDSYRLGRQGDFVDTDNDFLTAYGIGAGGAVLVRPDGFIGWRTREAVPDPEGAFESAFAFALGQPV
jgi:putative polyketide hydroxylase